MQKKISSSIFILSPLIYLFILFLLQLTCECQETWSPTSLNNAPEHRFWHTAVWTGSEMIVWGGQSNDFELNTGGKYNISSNSWSPTNTVNAPLQRQIHTAVWTGTRMIIWGGINFNGNGELNTGGLYNPENDTWTPVDTENAPSRRCFHTAIWTGNKMIVWGGSSPEEGLTNTGGIYDPVADTWIETSTINAPSPRYWHTAIWTGSKMIVWGGDTANFNLVNTGGIYDPVQNSWLPTSTTNAPSPREEHTAIWTGNKMIIWGGLDNSGGIYDPESDTWMQTSTVNAPQSRYVHSAIWTGIRMVIWGGIATNGNYVLNTGGIYNPLTNTWIATSLSNVPIRRFYHRALWTGNKMIVWGGDYEYGPLNSGGIYSNPAIIAINKLGEEIPNSFYLSQNYPNPFNPATVIKFDLPKDGMMTLKIYDLLGREVALLMKNEFKKAGSYQVTFDGSNYSSGVYFYRITIHSDRLESGSFVDTKRMVLIK